MQHLVYEYMGYYYKPKRILSDDGMQWILNHHFYKGDFYMGVINSDSVYFFSKEKFEEHIETIVGMRYGIY